MNRRSERFRSDLRALLPRLRRFGLALTGSRDQGDDLVQDAIERALHKEAQFEVGTRLDSWMFRIMQNTWIDQMRKNARRPTSSTPVGDLEVAGEDGSVSFLARIELDQVRQAMMLLHENERAVLVLVSIDGMSYREAAEALAIPIGTVMSRLARARGNLLALLARSAETEENVGRPL